METTLDSMWLQKDYFRRTTSKEIKCCIDMFCSFFLYSIKAGTFWSDLTNECLDSNYFSLNLFLKRIKTNISCLNKLFNKISLRISFCSRNKKIQKDSYLKLYLKYALLFSGVLCFWCLHSNAVIHGDENTKIVLLVSFKKNNGISMAVDSCSLVSLFPKN